MKLKRDCRSAERRWRKTKLEVHLNKFIENLKTYNKEIHITRQAYFANLINANINNPDYYLTQ